MTDDEQTGELPEGCLFRVEVYDFGVRVNLRDGMPAKLFADSLRLIADAFEQGGGIKV